MLIIGIAGGTGSGKTTVVKKVMANLPPSEVVVIPQDNYYKDNGHLPLEERLHLNFDHPDSIEFDLLIEHIHQLKDQQKIQMPIYSFLTCTRKDETIEIAPKKVIIIEGILILNNPVLRSLMEIKVYVDTDDDDRLIRCIKRDILERGRNVSDVLERYERTVKPMHQQFVDPSKRYADVIIPQGGDNEVGIRVISQMIRMVLEEANQL